METDTIVAIATPPGRGAIGLVRLSGPESLGVARHLCPDVDEWRPRFATFTRLRDLSGAALDEAVVTFFAGPQSYTGEDMLEVSCHGSPLVLHRAVESALGLGARAARPGEFTLRAFLNGKLDLTEAEAIVDLVEARTEGGLGLALQQLAGALSSRVNPARGRLLDLAAHLTALVEFSEEDIPDVPWEEMRGTLVEVRATLLDLLAGSRQGQVLQHGVALVVAGPPNAGKSSIVNRLLGRDRAIVTPIPGTTRDLLEEELSLEGVLFRIVDTAGLAESRDPVEIIGVERTAMALDQADVVLLVVDASRPLTEADCSALRTVTGAAPAGRLVVARNKSDLPERVGAAELTALAPSGRQVRTSAVVEGGLDGLRTLLVETCLEGPPPDGFVVSGSRHVQALRAATEDLDRALGALDTEIPLDLISLDIRSAAARLGEITGSEAGDEILDRVFSRFCIGK